MEMPLGPEGSWQRAWVSKVVKTLCDQELHLGLRVRGQQGLAARSPVGAHPMTAGTTVLVRAWTKLDVAAASPCRYPAGLVPHADLDAFPEQWSGALQAAAVACARSAAHEPALCAGATLCGPHACSRCCCITPLPLAVPSSSWCEISCPRAGACCRKARASCSKRAAYSTAAARIRAQTSPLHGVPARPTSVSRPRFDAASLDRLRATAPGYIYA